MTDRKTLIDAVDAETFTSDPGAGIECGNVDASELKPCPFCGGEVCFRYYSSTPNIHCEECGYERDFWDDDNHCPVPKEDAIAAWNTRYDLSLAKIEALEAKLAKAVEALEGWINVYTHCTIEEGVCCCGDDMKNHTEQHMPMDHGAYIAGGLAEQTETTLTELKEEN